MLHLQKYHVVLIGYCSMDQFLKSEAKSFHNKVHPTYYYYCYIIFVIIVVVDVDTVIIIVIVIIMVAVVGIVVVVVAH